MQNSSVRLSLFKVVLLLCLPLIVFASSCKIRRQGLLDPQMKFLVEPELFCPGDPVTVSWDFTRLSRSLDNCNEASTGFDRLTPCTSGADCPGGSCLDGFCCKREFFDAGRMACPAAEGCFPAFNVTITADTLTLEPPVESESHRLMGSRTVTPPGTTVFTMDADLLLEPVRIMRETRTARMVTRVPETNKVLEFPFQCARSGPGWPTVNVDLPRLASDNVRIVNVRNATRNIIEVSGGDHVGPPVTLDPGASSPEFNGAVRGIWMVTLSPRDPARASVPRCEETGIRNPWPDLRIELVLECKAGG